jgi:chitinase
LTHSHAAQISAPGDIDRLARDVAQDPAVAGGLLNEIATCWRRAQISMRELPADRPAVAHNGWMASGRRRMARVLIASAPAVLAGVTAVLVAACSTQATHAPEAPSAASATHGASATQSTPVNQPAPASGPWIAPYDYLAAGGPSPAQVMKTTGIRRFTLAFVVSDGACQPMWDNGDPLAGAPEEAAIREIRSAGGEAAVALGGMGGTKLGLTCTSPEALAGVYQQVISAYQLRSLDLDVEDAEVGSSVARQRIIGALAIVRQRNPGLMISVTIAADSAGPESGGQELISQSAAAGLHIDAWTIMPFDFSGPGTDMASASIQAAEGLRDDLMSAYHESESAAYRTMGISSMNGRTDAGELVSVADFQVILRYVLAHHLARFAFWSVNRDLPCTAGSDSNTCSGIAQQPYAFTRVSVSYHG